MATEMIAFVGEAARDGARLARALERLGYVTSEAQSVVEIESARAPVAVVVGVHAGVDPFRAVRAVRARSRFAHSLVLVLAPAGVDPAIGVAIAAGADDVLSVSAPLDDLVDRVAGRIARNRMLHDRATFDCVTHIRGRRFVDESLSAEIALAVSTEARATLGVFVLTGFATTRADRGFLAAEREVEAIAFALAAAVRPCDLPCRVAVDTFVVLLPGIAGTAAREVLEDARARMTAKAPNIRDVVFASAEAPLEGVAWQELFDSAEHRLPLAARAHTRSDQPARATRDLIVM